MSDNKDKYITNYILDNNDNDNKIFNNIGDTIHTIGVALFAIYMVLGTIFFFMIFILDDYSILFFMSSITCFTLSFLTGIPLCGFAQLIKDIHALREEFVIDRNNNLRSNNNSNTSRERSREQIRGYFN